MNVVSARAAALGDSFVRLQKKVGFDVHSEFYVNDSGRQIRLLGESVRARALQLNGQQAEIPEGGYHGGYVKDIARKTLQKYKGDLLEIDMENLGRWCAEQIVAEQRNTLEKYGITFDRWFFESELHRKKSHLKTLAKLEKAGHIYKKDGAKYFRSTDFGDDEDRVVVTSDGRSTYFLPDIAYHQDKEERGYDKAFDLLGPD
ncbi:MAG: arginine--tRNA ligase, partial [bacterium]